MSCLDATWKSTPKQPHGLDMCRTYIVQGVLVLLSTSHWHSVIVSLVPTLKTWSVMSFWSDMKWQLNEITQMPKLQILKVNFELGVHSIVRQYSANSTPPCGERNGTSMTPGPQFSESERTYTPEVASMN